MMNAVIPVALGVLAAIGAALLLWRSRRDAITLLTLFAVLLMLIPARFVLPGLGAFGMPALVLGLVFAAYWGLGRLVPGLGFASGPQPLRVALGVMLAVVLLSYVGSFFRHVSWLEASGSERALLTLLALFGATLMVADGVENFVRLETLLRRVLLLGVAMALIGELQFIVGFDLAQHLRLPGLVMHRELVSVGERAIFRRPASTALHPIEFGVTMAVLTPLALHQAWFAGSPRARRWWYVAVVVIAAAGLMSVSRSAVVGLAVGGFVLWVASGWHRRANLSAGAVAVLVMVWGLVPGLIGTLRNLFLRVGVDTSISARTDDYSFVQDILAERPFLGLGYGMYLPTEYRILDNQYLATAVETGVLGTTALALLLFTGLVMARSVARSARADEKQRHLAVSLGAALLASAVVMVTFDAFAFRLFSGVFYLILGLTGALWRIHATAHGSAATVAAEDDAQRSASRTAVA